MLSFKNVIPAPATRYLPSQAQASRAQA